MHDLWDEARFKLSRSIRTEELLERLIQLGAEGIGAFFETVAEERTYGFEYVTANRYDGYDIFTGFKGQSARSQQENAFLIKQMLHRVVEHRMHPQRAPELRQQIDFSSSARFLIETGEQLLDDQDCGPSEVDLQAEILARLDRHPAYHTDFLCQYRELTGQPDVVVKQNIQPEIERLGAWLPERPYGLTSDPQGFLARRRQFVALRHSAPDDKRLFTLLAALLVRLDGVENYEGVLDQVRALGDYARPGPDSVLQVRRSPHEAARRDLRVGQRHIPGHSPFGHIAEALDDEGQLLCRGGYDRGLAIGLSVGEEHAVDGRLLQVIVLRPIEVVRVRARRAAGSVAVAVLIHQKGAGADVVDARVEAGVLAVDVDAEHETTVESVSPAGVVVGTQQRKFAVPDEAQQTAYVFVAPGIELRPLDGVRRVEVLVDVNQVLEVEVVDVGAVHRRIAAVDEAVDELTPAAVDLDLRQVGPLRVGVDPRDLIGEGAEGSLYKDAVLAGVAPIDAAPGLLFGLLEGTRRLTLGGAGSQQQREVQPAGDVHDHSVGGGPGVRQVVPYSLTTQSFTVALTSCSSRMDTL